MNTTIETVNHRRRPGGALDRLPPAATRPAVPHPRGRQPRGRPVASIVGHPQPLPETMLTGEAGEAIYDSDIPRCLVNR